MPTEHFDLVIVGAGSGNTIPDDRFAHLNMAIIEKAEFGGTCLNRGCIPSKMFVYSAEVAEIVKHASTFGVEATFGGTDWIAIRDRVFGRIDPIPPAGEDYREGLDNTTVIKGHATFVEPGVLEVNDRRITADRIVLGVGSRPFIPPIAGLADIEYHTSDSIMRLDAFPEHLVIIGAGVIASEMGHVFEGLGAKVTIITRGSGLLSGEDEEIHERFTAVSRERFDILTHSTGLKVNPTDHGFTVTGTSAEAGEFSVEADCMLVATGRTPNSDTIGAEVAGIEIDEAGRVVVNGRLETNVDGIWAFGDLSAHWPLKHLANAEARVVAHNLLNPDDPIEVDYGHHPRAAFGSPSVASVGMTEQQLRAEGVPYCIGKRDYGDTAYGWAMEDTTSFAKVLASSTTGRILGAHIMGPHASTVIQPLIQAMAFGTTAKELASEVIYIHPALSEVVENALLDLPLMNE